MVDVNKTLKDVSKKGSILIGEKQTKAAVQKGTAKLVVIANNCPYNETLLAMAKEHQVPVYIYTATGVDLGYACGRNFPISAFAVLEEGESNILQLVQKRK